MTEKGPSNKESSKRKYLGIKFDCCDTYQRIYYNEKQKAYIGRCPRCLRSIKIAVDKEKGTAHRFFTAK